MTFIRWFLGRLILGFDFLTRPKPMVREQVEQEKLDALTEKFSLYQFEACPFCVKVRRQIRKYALDIEVRDAKNNAAHKAELLAEGGSHKVPCLRIGKEGSEAKWLYESDDIISYLKAELQLS